MVTVLQAAGSGAKTVPPAALIVVDMLNDFLRDDSALHQLGYFMVDRDKVISESEQMLSAARKQKLKIIFLRHEHRSDYAEASAVMRQIFERSGGLQEGTAGSDVIDRLAPRHGEIVISKRRYDGFLYTDLELTLRAHGVRRVIVSGIATHVCVESTARSAVQRDFETIVCSDTTTTMVGYHEPSLRAMETLGIIIKPWRDALSETSA